MGYGLVFEVLTCICLILTGAFISKPPGWVIIGLAVIMLLLVTLGGFTVGVGHSR